MKQFYFFPHIIQAALFPLCTFTTILSIFASAVQADESKTKSAEAPSSKPAQSKKTANSSETKVKRPKPTFFEQTRKIEEAQRRRKGFAANFLVDALNGVADPLAGIGGSGTGGFNAEFQGKSNFQNTSGLPQTVTNGTFAKTGSDSVSFTSSGSPSANFTAFDTSNPVTLNINGQSYSSANFGFSSNSAFAVFRVNGETQVYRVDGSNIRDFDTVPIGTTFQGSLVTGGSNIPDR
jgi:hypothetical protein